MSTTASQTACVRVACLQAQEDLPLFHPGNLPVAAVCNQVRPHLVQRSIHRLWGQLWRLARLRFACDGKANCMRTQQPIA